MRNSEGMFQFKNGAITILQTLPEWVRDALIDEQQHDDRDKALSDQGANKVETYGTLNETVDVWRMTGNGWLVDWWDTDSHVMSIFVATPIDFAEFQAKWIAPMALKIMTADVHIRDSMARQPCDAQSEAIH